MLSTCFVNQPVESLKFIKPGGATLTSAISSLFSMKETMLLAIFRGFKLVERASFKGRLLA